VQKLLALKDAIILRVNNFKVGPAACGRTARTIHLLDLKIVIFVHHRKQETRVVHIGTKFPL
jgi:hypothetical protein